MEIGSLNTHFRAFKGADDMNEAINRAEIRQVLGLFDLASINSHEIHKIHGRECFLFRLEHFVELVQTRIGHFGHAKICSPFALSEAGSIRMPAREYVK